MFGVVPKVLWQQCCEADSLNRIPLALTCLLIRAGDRNILVDTGLGSKEDEKFHHMFAVERPHPLLSGLKQLGIGPEDIDIVINTHLHFDHAGGNTMRDAHARLAPTFPRARYFVQRGEFDDATHANERTKASYRPENFLPLADAHCWEFLEGDGEIVPGITAVVTGGHTRSHQAVKLQSNGEVAYFLGDLIPTVSHLPLPYIMGYDLFPTATLESKRSVLNQAYEDRWLLLFEHDPQIQAGYVQKDEDGRFRLKEVKIWQ
jgi:glyoxylase-like metal-dependent hydrolase (beta-lactamase superfamily II)